MHLVELEGSLLADSTQKTHRQNLELRAIESQSNVILIDKHRLARESFIKSIEYLHDDINIYGYASADDYLTDSVKFGFRPESVIINIGSKNIADIDFIDDLQRLMASPNHPPFVILAESEDLDEMIAALDYGASGYVAASVGIDSIIEATKLAARGGIFLKAESLDRLRGSASARNTVPSEFKKLTSRQTAVANALRQGKPNKAIAYELDMCESTVKIHIRNIMRKLKATNRTEAAYKLNAMLSENDSEEKPAPAAACAGVEKDADRETRSGA